MAGDGDAEVPLVSPLRRLILSPEGLAERLHLTDAARVLEVGSGPGCSGERRPQGNQNLALSSGGRRDAVVAASPPWPERQTSGTIMVGPCEQELADVKVAALEPEPCG